jgi:hypothetical protein
MPITYRMLPLEEWDHLKPLYTELFPDRPFPANPEMSCVAVAEDEGKIVGFWFMHLCAHAEPVGIDPIDGMGVSLHALRNTLHEAFKGSGGMEYYITTDDSRLGEILAAYGFKAVGTMFVSQIPKDIDGS